MVKETYEAGRYSIVYLVHYCYSVRAFMYMASDKGAGTDPMFEFYLPKLKCSPIYFIPYQD